jgi:hypothetical protein
MGQFAYGTHPAIIGWEEDVWMRVLSAIAFIVATLFLQGCAALFDDPLRAAYRAGEISREEYEARCLERYESLARRSAAHSELLHACHANQSKLPPQ